MKRGNLVQGEMTIRRFLLYAACLLFAPLTAMPQAAAAEPPTAGFVRKVLATELLAAQDTSRPMRYTLRKSSPRFSSTKEIFETRDGAVARLVAMNDKPLSAEDAQKEQQRLDGLVSDPGRQRHRKQAQDDDMARVLKVLRALPDAFQYTYIGEGMGQTGRVEKFSFKPNPAFNPPDLETQVLTAMAGEIWIDATEERVVHLEGHLLHDVDFGWGILGRLYKNGWIAIEQNDVGNHQWRIVRFQMEMSGRIVVRTKTFETVEEQTNYTPVAGVGYVEAVHILKAEQVGAEQATK
jgi:hypothetical protein